MLEILIGGIFVTVVTAITVVAMNQRTPLDIDVLSDYQSIKTALLLYRRDKKGKCQNITDLLPYLENQEMNLQLYELSDDEKYLIVNAGRLKQTPETLVSLIGAHSHIEKGKAFLAFVNMHLISKIKAEAKIQYDPEDPLYTTTPITYDHSASITEDGFFSQVVWDNNKRYFSQPGRHLVRLRVKDINENWSDWASETLTIYEKPGFAGIATGPDSVFLIMNCGRTQCMGTNEFGQLGLETLTPYDHMTANPHTHLIESVACGDNHTLFKTLDDRLLTAGRNNVGQLGTGNLSDWKVPREIWGLEDIVQIAAGHDFSMALTRDGHVHVWGDNELMQLGNDKFSSLKSPCTLDSVYDIVQIACGSEHALALKSDGSVIAWGSNSFGQLALGYKEKVMPPTLTKLTNIVKIFAGKNTTFAVNADGHVWVCGQNNKNQLGLPGHQMVLEPEELHTLKDIVDLQSKGYFGVALSKHGEVFTWGKYSTQDDRYYEQPIKLENLKSVKAIGATTTHGYALTSSDELIEWSAAINVRTIIASAKAQSMMAQAQTSAPAIETANEAPPNDKETS